MRIVIIGTGNVATVMGRRLRQAGHELVQVFGRNAIGAEKLATEFEATVETDPSQLYADAGLYLIAVSDAAIGSVAEWLRVPGKLVAHTAGSVSMSVLKNCSEKYGVIYPLQSLRKQTSASTPLPLLIDGSNEDTRSTLMQLAGSISDNVSSANDAQRSKFHIAAVVMNNFSNYLYTLAADYCYNEKLDFRLLLPLVAETGERLKTFAPKDVQTGPAVRNDVETMAAHEQKLSEYPDLLELYRMFSRKIKQHNYFFFFFFLPAFISVS